MGERKHSENRRRRYRRKPKRRKDSRRERASEHLTDIGSSVNEAPPQGDGSEVMIYTYTRYKRAR